MSLYDDAELQDLIVTKSGTYPLIKMRVVYRQEEKEGGGEKGRGGGREDRGEEGGEE